MYDDRPEVETTAIVLTALYLRGAPHEQILSRRNWRKVESSLTKRVPRLEDSAESLRLEGLHAEALALETPGILAWAEDLRGESRSLTAVDTTYPLRWIQQLNDAAPPAVWLCGPIPSAQPMVSVVGSRQISRPIARFAADVGKEIARLGATVVSGNAVGCDYSAMKGAAQASGSVVGVLPHGAAFLGRRIEGVSYLSVCAPDEEFSRATAMERNALIYAAASFSVVVQCRFREGGTWHGAVEAQRRRLTRLIARNSPTDRGLRALIALGATPLDAPAELASALHHAGTPSTLFG